MVAPDVSDKFLSRNRVAGLTAVLVFPISEIAALTYYLPLVLPAGQVLAIALAAMLALLRGNAVSGAARWCTLTWLIFSGMIIFYLGLSQSSLQAVAGAFLPMFAFLLAFILLAHRLGGISPAWRKCLSCIMSASCLFVGAIIAWSILDAAVKFLPSVYDPVLYRIDAMLWLDGIYRLGDLLNANAGFRQFVLVLYKYNLVFAVPAIFSEAFYGRKSAAELTLQLLVSSFLVFPLFCMMPALDPLFFFASQFPDHLPLAQSLSAHSVITTVTVVRNTMPSLHATWAILIWLALRDSPFWQRVLGLLFLLITLVATLGFGEHYAVDWVAATPLVLLVRGICCASLKLASPLRQASLIAAVIMLALWVAVVRGAPVTLDFPWAIRALAVLSIVLPVLIEKRLFIAERRTSPVTCHVAGSVHAE